MMAITTSNSISVKPRRDDEFTVILLKTRFGRVELRILTKTYGTGTMHGDENGPRAESRFLGRFWRFLRCGLGFVSRS